MSSNVDRFLNKRSLENAILSAMVSMVINWSRCSARRYPKKRVGMNLDRSVNRFPRKRLGWTYSSILENYDVVPECSKGKFFGQEWHDGPREDWHEVHRGYTYYLSAHEYKSVNVPVCCHEHHESCSDVLGQFSKLVPRQKCYCKLKEVCHQVPKEVYNNIPRK